jgi:hypothetical protein
MGGPACRPGAYGRKRDVRGRVEAPGGLEAAVEKALVSA